MLAAPFLLTPRDWQNEALIRAAQPVDPVQAGLALVEAKRYGALADEIDRLRRDQHTPDWGAIDDELMAALLPVYPETIRMGLVHKMRLLLRKVSDFR